MKIFEIVITEKNLVGREKKNGKVEPKRRKLHMLFSGANSQEAKEKALEAFDNKKLYSVGRPNMILNTD